MVEGAPLVRAGACAGSWSEGSLAEEVAGSTLGIVGLGRIGSAVARRAHGFSMQVLYTQRRRVETRLGEYRELDDLFRESDLVSIHAPLTPDTAGMVDARLLSLLRDRACLVN